MASTTEQMVSNFSWAAFRKAKQLKNSLWFLFFALIVMRIGAHIPLPGVNSSAWSQYWAHSPFAHITGLF